MESLSTTVLGSEFHTEGAEQYISNGRTHIDRLMNDIIVAGVHY